MPAEKGVRHGHTEALSGTVVVGGEGHFSLLDTVGDRGEGRSSIGGLLGRGEREKAGRRKRRMVSTHSLARGRSLILRTHCVCWRSGTPAKGGLATADPASLPHDGVRRWALSTLAVPAWRLEELPVTPCAASVAVPSE